MLVVEDDLADGAELAASLPEGGGVGEDLGGVGAVELGGGEEVLDDDDLLALGALAAELVGLPGEELLVLPLQRFQLLLAQFLRFERGVVAAER